MYHVHSRHIDSVTAYVIYIIDSHLIYITAKVHPHWSSHRINVPRVYLGLFNCCVAVRHSPKPRLQLAYCMYHIPLGLFNWCNSVKHSLKPRLQLAYCMYHVPLVIQLLWFCKTLTQASIGKSYLLGYLPAMLLYSYHITQASVQYHMPLRLFDCCGIV